MVADAVSGELPVALGDPVPEVVAELSVAATAAAITVLPLLPLLPVLSALSLADTDATPELP